MPERISRRRFVRNTAGAVVGALACQNFSYGKEPKRYRIGVCDWMILKRQKSGAVARDGTITGRKSAECEEEFRSECEVFEDHVSEVNGRNQDTLNLSLATIPKA